MDQYWPFYGFPQGAMEPDWSKLTATISGHMAEQDNFFPPDAARALEAKLRGMGKTVTLTVHPGTGHAFMGPHNALGTFNATSAAQIWPEVVSFLKKTWPEGLRTCYWYGFSNNVNSRMNKPHDARGAVALLGDDSATPCASVGGFLSMSCPRDK
jgi:hypothetical protein